MPRERESLTEEDPHTLLFGDDDSDFSDAPPEVARSRAERGRQRRRRRRGRRSLVALTAVVAVVLVVLAVAGVHLYEQRYHPADFSGTGTGSVVVVVHPGDGAGAVGTTLDKAGVVASARAFSNAASHSHDAGSIAAGTYRLRKHMSGAAAVALLLDPASRLSNSVVVFEGATVYDVAPSLAKAVGVSVDAAAKQLADVSGVGLPNGYGNGGATPTSVEGFLFPATYSFDPGTSAADAIQEMITKFIDQDRATGFTAKARAAHLTPYEALIIASIAEKEAKLPADYPKVARVILNRLAAGMPLQIDATSAYAAKQQHLDPTKVIYSELDSPFNSYTHKGLPPTPIANPGAAALEAAVTPASGNWLYYVNGDKNGALFFTHDENAFAKAVQRCKDNNWGCG